MEKRLSVGIGELVVSRDPNAILVAHGLGSCVGISAFDKIKKVGGLLHVMLPIAGENSSIKIGAKFADTGIPLLLSKVEALGGKRKFIEIKIAGGAKMFNTTAKSTIFDVGERNIAQVKESIIIEGLKIVGEDTGLNYGRTMHLYLDIGKVIIKTFGKGEKEL